MFECNIMQHISLQIKVYCVLSFVVCSFLLLPQWANLFAMLSTFYFGTVNLFKCLFSKSSINCELWYFHPCPGKVVGDAIVLGFFFTALTTFLSWTAVVFLSWPPQCPVVSTPKETFVVLAMLLLSFKTTCFIYFLQQNQSSKLKPGVIKPKHSELLII